MPAQPLAQTYLPGEKKATPRIVDLSLDKAGRAPGHQGGRPIKSMSPKQIRARARRKQKLAEEELALLYKPIEQWDNEELARGRPRDKNGGWNGASPGYLNRAVHEQIVRRFEVIVRQEMSTHTVEALKVIQKILTDEEEDWKGRPRTSAATKLEAAKFLIEHVVGKPKQRVEGDISIKMQQMLGTVLVMPADANILDFTPSNEVPLQLSQGYAPIDTTATDDTEDYDDDNDSTGD